MVTYEEIIMQRALRESLQEVKSARECGTLVKAFSYQQTPAGDEEIQGYKDLNEYEVNIDKALHASLQNNTPGAQQSGPLPPPSQNVPNRPNIDDYIKDMHLRTALEMPMVRDPHGDTFVFIDPPSRQPEQDNADYERYIMRYKEPTVIKRDTLLKLNSPVLEKMFRANNQFRELRRRDLVNKLPPGIKYVLDLTPPNDGEQAVFLITELCCSEGVRRWQQSREIWRVSGTMIGGEEEYSSNRLPPSSPDAEQFGITGPHPCAYKLPLEYTPVRHRSAIERLIAAVYGHDPLLDSAPKVWTTFAVAKWFQIAESPLTDYIVRWLRAYPNSYFLEVLPEASIQIATGLKNYDLARDTFAILVGEEALGSINRPEGHPTGKQTIFGRKKEDLPDEIRTAVEYASKNFHDRIKRDFQNFISMQWIDGLPEVLKFKDFINIQRLDDLPKVCEVIDLQVQNIVKELKSLLKDYVRGPIFKLLCVNYQNPPPADLPNPGGEDLLPRISRKDVWAQLTLEERILTRTFYQALQAFKLFEGETNLQVTQGWNPLWSGGYEDPFEVDLVMRGTYCEVQKETLIDLIADGQRWLINNKVAIEGRDPSPARAQSSDQPSSIFATSWGSNPIIYGSFSGQVDACTVPSYSTRVTGLETHNSSTLASRKTFENLSKDWPAPNGFADWAKEADAIEVGSAECGASLQRSSNGQVSLPHCSENRQEYPKKHNFSLPDLNVLKENVASLSQEDSTHTELPTTESNGHTGQSVESVVGDRLCPSYQNVCSPTNSTAETQPAPSTHHIDPTTPQSKPPINSTFFRLSECFLQASAYIKAFSSEKLQLSDQLIRAEPLLLGITNTLVCLSDNEWKYLPLWAGGNDDGSNGVFSDELPIAEMPFSTAGPNIHTGTDSSRASSDFDFISNSSVYTSNMNPSTATANGSYDYGLLRGRTYAANSASIASSDDFTTIMIPSVSEGEDMSEEEAAGRQIEAMELLEEAEAELKRREKGKMNVDDESYADLFSGDDDDVDEDMNDDEEDSDETERGDGDRDDEIDEADGCLYKLWRHDTWSRL